jgi:amphi-Trp domain-containing protein
MTNLKFKKQERMARVEAADRLTEIAEALRNGARYELERNDEKLELELNVPDDVLLEFEVDIKDGRSELEVEIKWA